MNLIDRLHTVGSRLWRATKDALGKAHRLEEATHRVIGQSTREKEPINGLDRGKLGGTTDKK